MSEVAAEPRNEDVAAYLGDPAAAANPEAHKLESYPWLDWLRFVLAATVFLDHSGLPLPRPIDGGLAVAVFLALSGWLIGGILIRSEPRDLPRFFYNRSTRIWAPYFATMALLYALALVREGASANWLRFLFYDVTFTHINWVHFPRATFEMPLRATGNHFWSISVEEQFYLFAPLVMLFVRWGRHPLTWVAITALLAADQQVFAPIGAGVCAAAINARRPIGVRAGERWLAAAAAAVVLVLLHRWRQQEAFVALFGVFAVVALVAPGRRTRLGVFVGAISYPLYLNHWIALLAMSTLVKHAAFSYPAALGVGSVIAVAGAAGAWWLVDRAVLLHRNGWYTPARGRTCAILAYTLVAIGLAGGYILQTHGY